MSFDLEEILAASNGNQTHTHVAHVSRRSIEEWKCSFLISDIIPQKITYKDCKEKIEEAERREKAAINDIEI